MPTRISTALAGGSAKDAARSVAQQCKQQLGGAPAAFALVFASTQQPLREVMAELRKELPGVPLLGASSAGEFTEKGDAKASVSLFVVSGDFRIHAGLGEGLGNDASAAVASAAKAIPESVEGYPHRTVLMLVDPLSGRGEEAALLTTLHLGGEALLAGGAAGDDLKMTRTEVALDDRVATDAVVLAGVYSKSPLGVGVFHGHSSMSSPMKVTRAEGNIVHEVDGRPAWDVWVEKTKADPKSLTGDQVGAFLLKHEAGLRAGNDLKIRAPLARTAAGALSFACGIPEGAEIQITESDPQRQIASAREAARRAKQQLGQKRVAGALVFDCICRNLILAAQFQEAVKAISTELGGVPLAGFETYGEIALGTGAFSGFHNTTTVVLAFPES